MKVFVLSPFYPVSDKTDVSHRAGWARYWANELAVRGKEEVTLLTTGTMRRLEEAKKGDVVACYHGMEFKGALNLQSGLTDEILSRVDMMNAAMKKGVRLVSLDEPMPNYARLLQARDMDDSRSDKLAMMKKSETWAANTQYPTHIIFGDSHALSMYTPGSVIARHDSLTMFGAMKDSLRKTLDDWTFEKGVAYDSLNELTVYFGNIDIRHHLYRQDQPEMATKKLIQQYGIQLHDLLKLSRKKIKIEVVMPLPIEDESRPIPKSGWYKGAAFAGTWHERHQLRLIMRDEIKKMVKKHGFTTYEHPKHFTQKDGKLDFEVMEKPRSVHIRPSEYRLVQEGIEWLV